MKVQGGDNFLLLWAGVHALCNEDIKRVGENLPLTDDGENLLCLIQISTFPLIRGLPPLVIYAPLLGTFPGSLANKFLVHCCLREW